MNVTSQLLMCSLLINSSDTFFSFSVLGNFLLLRFVGYFANLFDFAVPFELRKHFVLDKSCLVVFFFIFDPEQTNTTEKRKNLDPVRPSINVLECPWSKIFWILLGSGLIPHLCFSEADYTIGGRGNMRCLQMDCCTHMISVTGTCKSNQKKKTSYGETKQKDEGHM